MHNERIILILVRVVWMDKEGKKVTEKSFKKCQSSNQTDYKKKGKRVAGLCCPNRVY